MGDVRRRPRDTKIAFEADEPLGSSLALAALRRDAAPPDGGFAADTARASSHNNLPGVSRSIAWYDTVDPRQTSEN